MANKTMHHLVIEDNNYEILDAKNRANIAAEYSASSTYKIGDVVLYNGQLYKCTTAITTAEAWTAAHWTAVTVGEKIASLEADTSQLKEEIDNDVSFIGGKEKTFSITGSAITVEKSKTEFLASAGEKISIKYFGTATSSGRAYVYVYYEGASSATNIGTTQYNTEREFTLTNNIVAVGMYISGGLTAGTITLQVKSNSKGLTSKINTLENTTVKTEDNIITEELYGNYWLQSGRIFGRYGLLSKGGEINVTALSANYQIAIRSWVDSKYTTKDQDTGWLSTPGAVLTVKQDRYYDLVMRVMNGQTEGQITDIDVINEVGLDYSYILKQQAVKNKAEIDNIYNIIAHTPPVLSKIVRTIAHRGDQHEAPRNTAPAYIVARNRGVLIAENDVTLSMDNEYVCWHDTTFGICGNLIDINGYLMYTNGTDFYYVKDDIVYTWNGAAYETSSVPLSSITRCAGSNYTPQSLPLAIMKRIDVGKYKSAKFAGTQILTFEEWVLLCKQLGMEIYVDRKIDWTDAQLTELAQIVNRLGMGDYSSWLSIYAPQIPVLRNVIPGARVGVLSHPSDSGIATYAPYNIGRGFFFNGNAKNGLSASVVQKGLDAGFEVEAWYVDYPNADTESDILANIKTYVSYGLTALTLDHYRVDDAFKDLTESFNS